MALVRNTNVLMADTGGANRKPTVSAKSKDVVGTAQTGAVNGALAGLPTVNKDTKNASSGGGVSGGQGGIVSQDTWDKINTPFQASASYTSAMNFTNGLLAQLTTGRTSYSDQVDAMIKEIQNREDFEYDVDKDMMFQQALSSAMQSGKTAMQDTIGQASALTGGYGSTYATSAGNQAYNAYIQDAYNNLPEYYQMAMEAYQMEGEEMYNQLAMLNDADMKEYERLYNSWSANYTTAQDMYRNEYTAWADSVGNAFNSANLQINESNAVFDQAMASAKFKSDEYWKNQNFIEEQRQHNENLTLKKEQFKADEEYRQNALAQENEQYYAGLAHEKELAQIKASVNAGNGKDFNEDTIDEALDLAKKGKESDYNAFMNQLAVMGYSESQIDTLNEYIDSALEEEVASGVNGVKAFFGFK